MSLTTPTKTDTANGKTDMKIHAPRRLDIACGQNKQSGFKGIDLAGDADIIHDLNELPWPIKTSSVQEAFSSHYIEHVPHWRPGWEKDGWWRFFDELHRVMKNEGTAEFIHPYCGSHRAFWDPTHVRFIHEVTWYYLDRNWRREQGIDHYGGDCDFEVVTVDGVGIPDEHMTRNHESQAFALAHYWNVIPDLRVILKARK